VITALIIIAAIGGFALGVNALFLFAVASAYFNEIRDREMDGE
jgi:hypothetical protein